MFHLSIVIQESLLSLLLSVCKISIQSICGTFIFIVLGGIGYYIERRYRGTPTTPVPHEKSIIDERSDRQGQQELIASPYKMDSVIPTTIFVRNDPNDLKKST